MSEFKAELVDCENVLLREIADTKTTRKSLALTYAMAICSRETPNFSNINRAIIDRWSVGGLNYIKTRAWKLIEEKQKGKP